MGILDQAFQSQDEGMDPRTQGILKAAFALMAAGGPTRMPTGFGEALGQAGSAGVDTYEAAKKAQLAQVVQRLQAEKLAQEVDAQRQIGILDMNDPEKLKRYGMLTKKPEFITHAERIEKKRDQEAQLAGMKQTSETIQPDTQEIGQAEDQGTPAPQPATVKKGGLFATLLDSPYVGKEAGMLQSQLNTAKGANPEDYVKHYERLFASHRTAQEKDNERLARELNLPKSEHVIQDRNSPTGWSYEDTRTFVRTPGAPPPQTGAAAGDVIPSQHKDLHGADYLQTLPTGMASLVKKIADGDESKNVSSLRYGNREAIMQRVYQYDPTYTDQRYKVVTEYKSSTSKTGQNIVAINQALAHAGTLSELADAIKNGDLRQINGIVSRVKTELGKPEVNNADLATQALSNELMRVFRQVNASETETKDFERKLDAAKASPAQIQGALRTGAKLLKGRIDALQDQYHRGTGLEADFPILGKESQRVLGLLGVVGSGIPLSPSSSPSSGGWTPEKEQRFQELKRRQGGS